MEIEPKFKIVKYGSSSLAGGALVLKPAYGGKCILGIKASECLVVLSLNGTRSPDNSVRSTLRDEELVFDLSEKFRITPSSDCADYSQCSVDDNTPVLTLVLGDDKAFLAVPAKTNESGPRLLDLEDGSIINPPSGYLVAVSKWDIGPVAIDRKVTTEKVEPMGAIFTFPQPSVP